MRWAGGGWDRGRWEGDPKRELGDRTPLGLLVVKKCVRKVRGAGRSSSWCHQKAQLEGRPFQLAQIAAAEVLEMFKI